MSNSRRKVLSDLSAIEVQIAMIRAELEQPAPRPARVQQRAIEMRAKVIDLNRGAERLRHEQQLDASRSADFSRRQAVTS